MMCYVVSLGMMCSELSPLVWCVLICLPWYDVFWCVFIHSIENNISCFKDTSLLFSADFNSLLGKKVNCVLAVNYWFFTWEEGKLCVGSKLLLLLAVFFHFLFSRIQCPNFKQIWYAWLVGPLYTRSDITWHKWCYHKHFKCLPSTKEVVSQLNPM